MICKQAMQKILQTEELANLAFKIFGDAKFGKSVTE